MSNHEHFLQLFLRIIGTTSLTAAFFVFVPQAWLEAIHQQLAWATYRLRPSSATWRGPLPRFMRC